VLARLKRWAAELKANLVTLWFCRKHPDTPWTAKLMAALVVAYAFSPIDLIPDFIPVLGYLDDLILVPLGIYVTLRLIPPHVLTAARAQAQDWIAQREARPKNYLAAALIVALWLAVAYWAWTVVRQAW
jgi:uncharacterized membrane protein YkvA (DUF1232 family)